MIVIYFLQNNSRSHYLVTIDICGANCSQNDYGENELNSYRSETWQFKESLLTSKPNTRSFVENPIRRMTEMSGVRENLDFDVNNLLLDVTNPECNSLDVTKPECNSLERNDKDYVFNSGFEFFKFATEDRIVEFTTNMCNSMIRYFTADGKNTYFLFVFYEFIRIEKIEEGSDFMSTNDSVDHYDYHALNGGENEFKKRKSQKFIPSIIQRKMMKLMKVMKMLSLKQNSVIEIFKKYNLIFEMFRMF